MHTRFHKPPAPEEPQAVDIGQEVDAHLRAQRYEAAFSLALNSSDGEHVLNLLANVPMEAIFTKPPQLSSETLLKLAEYCGRNAPRDPE